MDPAREFPPDSFVGRDLELGVLIDRVVSRGNGSSGPVLVVGEPGIGKTRLVQELVERLGDEHRRVVWGRAWDEIECPPYWPWTNAVRELLGETTAADLRHLVLDEPEHAERFELFAATTAVLRREAEQQPVVVVIDDLHAADVPTLLLTRFVTQELVGESVVVVLAHRPVDPEVRPEVYRHLEALAQAGTTVQLGGLDVDDIAELVPDPRDAAQVQEVTGGNPLFVDQVVRAATAMVADPSRSEAGSTTQALRATIKARLASLQPVATGALVAIAMLGRRAPSHQIATLTIDDLRKVDETLDDLAGDGLVRFMGAGREATIHALVGEAVLSEIAPERLAELHHRVAVLLADDPDRVIERAHHLLRAGPEHAGEAIAACRAAATQVTSDTAHDEAVVHLERALAVLDHSGPHVLADPCRARLEILLDLGRAQRRADLTAAADETFEIAAEVASELGDATLVAEAALGGGVQYFTRLHRDPRLADRVSAALEGIGDDESGLAARLLADLAGRSADADEAEQLAGDAVAMARRVGDPIALGYSLLAEQVVAPGPSTLGRRLTSSRELVALAPRVNDPLLAVQSRFLLFAALLEHADLRGFGSELLSDSDRDELLAGRSAVRLGLWVACVRAMLDGDLDRAESAADRSLELGLAAGDPWAFRVYGAQLGVIRLLQGRLQELEPVYSAQHRDNPDEPVWCLMLAYLASTSGRDDEARRMLSLAGGLDRLPDGIHRLVSLTLFAETVARVGDPEQVAEARERLLPYADRFVPVNLGAAVWGPVAPSLGRLAFRAGRIDEGLAHLTRAVDVCERLGARLWLAESRVELAEQLVAAGRADDPRLPGLRVGARADAVELGLAELIERVDVLGAVGPTIQPVDPVPVDRPRVAVLGTFEVRAADGRVARWSSRKARELLKLLVTRRGAPVHREVVMDVLWPGVAPSELRNRLAVALNSVRRALDPDRDRATSDLVATDRDTIRLCVDEVEVDVERYLGEARAALDLHRLDAGGAVTALVEASRRYTGPALPDEPYADWATALRDEVQFVHLRVVRALADRSVASGDHLAAADAFRELVEADPLDAAAHQGLVEQLRRIGAAALADAERHRYREATGGRTAASG